MKKAFLVLIAVVFCVTLTGLAFAAEAEKTAKPVVKSAAPADMPQGMRQAPGMRASFAMIPGTITKIDNSDPANVKIEVKSDADNQTHVITLTPWTNISKMTDVSELKTGEAVRIMARKTEDKVVAMQVLFGKFQNIPAPRPMGEGMARPGRPIQKPVTAPAKEGTSKK